MSAINEHVNAITDLVLPGDRNEVIGSSDIILSTMTLDGQVSNVKFDKVDAINHLALTNNVVEIGCNYGYMILEEYKSWPCFKDRMKKKKRKEGNSSRRQGLGTHFNSQVTFTVVSETDDKHSYQVKLFTNGRLQIPGIGKLSKSNDALLENILSIIVSYIMSYPDVLMLNKNNPVGVAYLTPILQNYKSVTLTAEDCMNETRVIVRKGMRYQVLPCLHLAALENVILEFKRNNRTPFPIDSIAFNPERYAGMLIKFSTPSMITKNFKIDKFIEMAKLFYFKNISKPRATRPPVAPETILPDSCSCMTTCVVDCYSTRKIMRVVRMIQNFWFMNGKASKRFHSKLTTVKLFRSGLINLDHVNNREQATIIRKFVVEMITDHWDEVVYYEQ